MEWQEQLISVYLMVCKEYEQNLCAFIIRLSNYSNMRFTDQEVMTIYMNGIMSGLYKLKDIYTYTKNHLKEWFPKLPSYVAFVQRLNKISYLFEILVDRLLGLMPVNMRQNLPELIDSMPIILAHRGRRFKARVAPEIATSNGYCATKKLHYYGVKLHMMGQYETGSLPIPTRLGITDAGTADIKVLDEIEQKLPEGLNLFADKAYQRENEPIAQKTKITLYTPVKREKGQVLLDAADRLLSRGISAVRQPIESLFNWIEEKTNIQIASKVRSCEGLMVHVYGKIAAALFMLKQRLSS